MTQNNHNTNIVCDNDLSQDAQDHWWEILSPTEMRPGEGLQINKKKSKCHGNRKLQHFKRKCRARGMTTDAITDLINTRNNDRSTNNVNNLVQSNNNKMNKSINKKKIQVKKRKRSQLVNRNAKDITKSLSQLSVSQPLRKKAKKEDKQISDNHDDK